MSRQEANAERAKDLLARQGKMLELISTVEGDWMEENAPPVLRVFLNQAQARLTYPIKFVNGMGSNFLVLDRSRGSKPPCHLDYFDVTRMGNADDAWDWQLQVLKRFPELVLLLDTANTIMRDSQHGYEIGDVRPSVPPRPHPQET